MPFTVTGGGGSTDQAGTNAKATGVNSHAEGKSTLASNTGAHAEGLSTTSTALQSHAEGTSSSATGDQGHAEGYFTTAGATAAHAEGSGAQATGDVSHAGGRTSLATRMNQWARGAEQFAALGDNQYSSFGMWRITTDATPGILSAEGGGGATLAGSATSVWTVKVGRGNRFRLEVIARNTGADQFAGWTIVGTLVRHSSGSARFISTPTVTADKDAAASAWDCAVSINTGNSTNNYLAVTVTGAAATTIRWVGTLYVTEVG